MKARSPYDHDYQCPWLNLRITTKVPRYEIKKGGFFSADYCMFLVETELHKAKRERVRVFRKDADFYTLRKFLRTQFPYMLVPPLPSVNKSLSEKVVGKRQRFF